MCCNYSKAIKKYDLNIGKYEFQESKKKNHPHMKKTRMQKFPELQCANMIRAHKECGSLLIANIRQSIEQSSFIRNKMVKNCR